MLSALDESFLHQTSLTFDEAATSDHRFFDRMWFGAHSLQHMHIVMGLAAYKNTNTFDGSLPSSRMASSIICESRARS